MNTKTINSMKCSKAAILFAFAAISSSHTFATTFTVNANHDSPDMNPGDGVCSTEGGDCSLRAAINEANALAGQDIIDVPAGTYVLTNAGVDDSGIQGDLDILDDLTIRGAGADQTIIDAAQIDRVFDVDTLSFVISGIQFKNGMPADADQYFSGGGGAIRHKSGDISIYQCDFTDNTTATHINSVGNGGAIESTGGWLIISDSTFTNNSTGPGERAGNGGAIAVMGYNNISRFNLQDSTFTGNRGGDSPNAWAGNGGAVYVERSGYTIIHDNTFMNNHGGHSPGDGWGGSGGAIYERGGLASNTNRTFDLSRNTFEGNYAGNGLGHCGGSGGAVELDGSYTWYEIRNNSFNNNRGGNPPGEATGSNIWRCADGGSISVDPYNSRVVYIGNSISNSMSRDGGALYWSTFRSSDVSAPFDTAVDIFSHNYFANNGSAGSGVVSVRPFKIPTSVSNNTFYNNDGTNSATLFATNADISLQYNTFLNNSGIAVKGARGVQAMDLSLFGNILQSNDGLFDLCVIEGDEVNLSADSSNFATDSSCGGATLSTTAELALQMPADNGGSTLTSKTGVGSIVRNAIAYGDSNCGTEITEDQRGADRLGDTSCDAGAYEDTSDDPAFGSNLISNGKFSSRKSPWELVVNQNKAEAIFKRNNKEALIEILTAGPNLSNIKLKQAGLFLQEGQTYYLQFDAKSAAGARDIKAKVGGSERLFHLSQEFNTFGMSFTFDNATTTNGSVEFRVGSNSNDVRFDNLSLVAYNKKGTSSTEKIIPGAEVFTENGSVVNSSKLKVVANEKVSYIKFIVPDTIDGLGGNPAISASIKLRGASGSTQGTIRVFAAAHNDWSDETTNPENLPEAKEEVANLSSSFESGKAYSLDLSEAVTGPGTYSFVIKMDDSGNNDIFNIKNTGTGSKRPKLSVTSRILD